MTVLTFPAAPRAGSIPASSPGSEHAPSPGPSALLRTTRARGPHQHPACPELSTHPATPGLLPTCSALSHKVFISDPAHAVTHQLLLSLSRGRGSPGPGDGKSSGTCPALPLPLRQLPRGRGWIVPCSGTRRFCKPLRQSTNFSGLCKGIPPSPVCRRGEGRCILLAPEGAGCSTLLFPPFSPCPNTLLQTPPKPRRFK